MWFIPGTMGMPLGAFLVFWTLMIVAMMGPSLALSLAPVASLRLETTRLRMRGIHLVTDVGAFVIGYLLVWAAFGLPIFSLAALQGYFATNTPPMAVAAAAVTLVVAGCYQLTPLHARCLASCSQRMGAHAHACVATTRSPLRTVGAGVAHGMDCLGTCGGCMLLFVAVGLMNIPWMIALTLIVWAEKVWRYGDHLARVVGWGLALLGILTAVNPRLILGWS